MKIIGIIAVTVFAWWDGLHSIARVVGYFAGEADDFALERMQLITTKRRPLTPEAAAYAARVNRERFEVMDALRKNVDRLNELDALYERILIAGRVEEK